MQTNHELPLTFDINITKLPQCFLIGLTLLALVPLFANNLVMALKIPLFGLSVTYFVFSYRTLHDGPKKIRYSLLRSWEVCNDKDFEKIIVLPSTVLTAHAIFLSYKHGKRIRNLLILKRAMPTSDFCRLLVKLKTNA
ncbi:MAG: hypothetical protein WC782_01385 [Methylococcaceae bacterium]|jgi:hypothetical protein